MKNPMKAIQADKDLLDSKLSLKQRKFIKFYLESGNASESALKSGYKNRQRGFELVSKFVNSNLFQKLLEQNGLNDNELIKVLKEGLQATKVIGYLNQKTNGTQKVSDEFVEIPDHNCRHRYLETALKLKHLYPEKEEHTQQEAVNKNKYDPIIVAIPPERVGEYNRRLSSVPNELERGV